MSFFMKRSRKNCLEPIHNTRTPMVRLSLSKAIAKAAKMSPMNSPVIAEHRPPNLGRPII